ncbi:hypothetical protein PCC7418_2622 [Halothece sp. PCC 7418]|uniref:DUF3352 domain-containing protein n=1 Tax=Halothece sp. (strain PCC 7418) TaxID=65093 RepID=UPI0002A07826|nr:DUF3352 domain-containing protein [Halothece sp. PCC 7418]AFZ44764.1 hypothetical protein PCC7418_2622 [Halothece sp. PCC 7418]
MFNKKRITLVGIILLLIAGGIYGYFRLIVGKRLTPQASAKILPESASTMLFMETDPEVWSELEQYGTTEAQAVWQSSLQELEQEFLPDANIDYEEDVAPWLSGIAIANFPSINPFSQEENVLLIAGITNSLKAGNFLRSLESNEETEVRQRQYKGVTITEVKTAQGDRASAAMLQGYVLFSQQGNLIEQTIDTAQGDPAFASDEGVQKLLSQGLNLENPAAQVYFRNYTQWLGNNFSGSGLDIIESAVMGVSFEAEGLHLQTLALSAETNFLSLSPNDSQLLSEFPDSTLAVINGHQLDQVWSQVVRQSEDNPVLGIGLSVMRRWAKSWDLDLDQDVFSWLDGEYAIALFPTEESSLPNLPLAGGILIQSSQREVGEQTLAKLGKIAAKNPFLDQETETLGNTTITTWEDPSQQPLLSYGWLQDERLMVTVGTPFRIFAQQQGERALKNSRQFSAIAQQLPETNFGYIYLDMQQGMTLLETIPQQPLKNLSPEAKATLNSIRQIALTASQPKPSLRQIDLFLSLESTATERK